MNEPEARYYQAIREGGPGSPKGNGQNPFTMILRGIGKIFVRCLPKRWRPKPKAERKD